MGPNLTNIIVIDLLPASELQTGLGLVRHLQDNLTPEQFRSVAYKAIETEADLDAYFIHVRTKARIGCKPVIHIECHGDQAQGLRLSRGHFPWERLLGHLQKINRLSGNNVVLFLSGCYGTGILRSLDITKPCPFLILVSSDEEVKAGFIQDNVGSFYVKLLQSRDFKLAARGISPNFRAGHAELLFVSAFASYIKDHSTAKTRQYRLDKLLTDLSPLSEHRSATRKQIRVALRDDRSVFEKYGRVFLHGSPSFTYSDFERSFRASAA